MWKSVCLIFILVMFSGMVYSADMELSEVGREVKSVGEEITVKIVTTEAGEIEYIIIMKKNQSEFQVRSRLELQVERLIDGIEFEATLSDETKQRIKIMPDKVSEIAIGKLKSGNISLELKEQMYKDIFRVVYHVEANKTGKFLAIFKMVMKEEVQIDPETGEVLNHKKPWWAFLVKEGKLDYKELLQRVSLFVKDKTTSVKNKFVANWSETTKLSLGDEEGELFGRSVSTDGDYVIVGANKVGDDKGVVHIFNMEGTSWVEQAEIIASDGDDLDRFGHSVSISGWYALVGAPGDDSRKGSVYIFRRDGMNWVEQAKITASDGETLDLFGSSVSIKDGYALVGAPGDDNRTGSAYIFKMDGTNWIEHDKITASDGEKNDRLGWSVSISGGYVIVGAWGTDNRKGSAYIFKRDGTNWVEHDKITASDGEKSDTLGWSVSIKGKYALVGAPGCDNNMGSAYIFKRVGINWIEQDKITASDGERNDILGRSVSLRDGYAFVGASGNDNRTGSAYIFKRDGTNWVEQVKITASDRERDDLFGDFVSISDDYAIVGVPEDNNNTGSVYIYELS